MISFQKEKLLGSNPKKKFGSKFICRVPLGQSFEFVKFILFLKTYVGGGVAPSSQTDPY